MYTCMCHERDGPVRRHVRLMPRSVARIAEIQAHLSTVQNFLPKVNPVGIFLDGANTFFEVDDVGIIAVLPGPQGLHVHVTFWDKRLRGREGLCRELSRWVSKLTGKELFTYIPDQARSILMFALRAGFTGVSTNEKAHVLRFTDVPLGLITRSN